MIPGATDLVYTATQSGNYSVQTTVSGCMANSSAVNVINSSIEDPQKTGGLLYPMPASEFFVVPGESKVIHLSDLRGRLLRIFPQCENSVSSQRICVADHPNGTYLLSNKEGKVKGRVVVLH